MKYDFKLMSLLNVGFCMVVILSEFLYYSHSSQIFTENVGYGLLKDVYYWGAWYVVIKINEMDP